MKSGMEKIELVKPNSNHTFTVDPEYGGMRIDVFLSHQFPSYSRSFFEKLIEDCCVKINDTLVRKKSVLLKENDTISVTFPLPKRDPIKIKKEAKNLDVEIVYEHPHFIVVNKPAGLMVHTPHPDSVDVTLVDWLLANFDELKNVGHVDRPGIVHRLDKDTTGLIIIPRNNCAHAYFGNLFRDRKIKKTYLAIVKGHPDKTGEIKFDIARHPSNRSKMTHVTGGNRPLIKGKIRKAKTVYKVIEYFDDYSLVEVYPVTGRTHQIRVHFAGIGHPLLGDAVYGEKSKTINRHALHAQKLEFDFEGKQCSIIQEPPKDFKQAICSLRKNKSENFS